MKYFVASLFLFGGTVTAAADGPIVIELFTSQGCSSCPPAHDLLIELAESPEYRDKIIPLAFHVDYWNYIGWRDPFSSKEWSNRQRAYARAFRARRIYTPQLVINGASETVGSSARTVRAYLAHALAQARGAAVAVELEPVRKSAKW